MNFLFLIVFLNFFIERDHIDYTNVYVYDYQPQVENLSYKRINQKFKRFEKKSFTKRELTKDELLKFNNIFKFTFNRGKICEGKLNGKILFINANDKGISHKIVVELKQDQIILY